MEPPGGRQQIGSARGSVYGEILILPWDFLEDPPPWPEDLPLFEVEADLPMMLMTIVIGI